MALKSASADSKIWFLFAAFVLFLTLLSYGPIPDAWKAFLFGLALLAVLALGLIRDFPGRLSEFPALYKRELFPRLPTGALLFLAVGAIFIRFYKLTTLFIWPGLDESLLGMFALHLREEWNWKFFYTFGQVPPLPIWATALLLKGGLGFLFSLWFPPAVVSSLTVLAGYAAARQFFPKSMAFILGSLLGFSYWPFVLGRVCHQGIWLPLWSCLCLFFLGRFLKAAPGPSQNKRAAALGLVTGLGSLTFTPWPAMALAVSGAVLAVSFPRKARGIQNMAWFLAALLVSLIPFFVAALREGYGQHIQAMSALSGWFSWKHQALTVFSYVTALFWGCLERDSAYTGHFGGMLNPLWGGAFFIGLFSLVRNRAHGWIQWTVLALVLGMLPGLLSMNVEMFRVAVVLPLLYFIIATGLAELLLRVPSTQRLILFMGLLACGALLDGGRILKWQSFPETPEAQKAFPMADIRSYQVLREVSNRYGPGLIFTEFTETPYDESLFDTTYDFNAAENPRLVGTAQWAGIVTNPHFYPCIVSRFPGSAWYRLDRNHPEDPERILETLPINPKTLQTLQQWTLAHHYFRKLSLAINSISEDQSYQAAEREFLQKPTFIGEDPFLEACYWERRAEFFYNYNFRLHYDDQVQALQQALRSGCPAAHLYYKLGSLLLRKGHLEQARKAFQGALREEPHYQDVLDALEILRGMESKERTKSRE